ncbi:MAG: transporter [Clostridiaceae bacterium]|nr:transporter [Clostridiaceae bacterium]
MKKIRSFLLLQLAVLIYTMASVAAKIASGCSFLSGDFILFYGLELAALGAYALLWQQVIKRLDLSTAYIGRALSIIWLMLWAVLIFQEKVSLNNLIGVAIVIAGIVVVNQDGLE